MKFTLVQVAALAGIAVVVLWSRSRRRRGLPFRLNGGRRGILPQWGNGSSGGGSGSIISVQRERDE